MENKKNTPPKMAERFLGFVTKNDDDFDFINTFNDLYLSKYESGGKFRADSWYRKQVLLTIPKYLCSELKGDLLMVKNYFKVAIRNIKRHKGYSFINIAGLAIGISVCLLIMLWVQDELNFDRFHPNGEHIYQAFTRQSHSGNTFHTRSTPAPLAPALKNNFPQVENACRYLSGSGKQIAYRENGFSETALAFADPDFLDMFNYPLIEKREGNPLSNPFSIVITEEMAKKYFGSLDAVGKILRIDNRYDFEVTGILKNISGNSTYRFGLLIPFSHVYELLDYPVNSWSGNWGNTFVQLKPGVDYRAFQGEIAEIIKQHTPSVSTVMLTPYHKLHLYTLTGQDAGVTYVYIFTIISFFVLFIACINFMNLSTARASRRAKEIGLRKVVGAGRKNLMIQFFGESMIYTAMASFLAFFIVTLFLPVFNHLSAKDMELHPFQDVSLWVMLFAITVIAGIASGIYPSLYLSSFKPAMIFKGITRSAKRNLGFRKMLVIFQFALSAFLIIFTMVIFRQIHFMTHQPLGYDKENLAYVNLRADSPKRYETVKNEFLTDPEVIQITATSRLPVSTGYSTWGYDWEGKNPDSAVLINTVYVDYNYLDVMGMKLAEGNPFQVKKQDPNKLDPQYILNQEAIRQMGMKDPLNKWFSWNDIKKSITGVVKDFNFATLQEEIAPILIVAMPQYSNIMLIRINTGDIHRTISSMEEKWKRINPHIAFNLNFLDETLNRLYQTELRVGNLARYFTFLALFITCLGLFGLASFMTEQRKKEIGIRKSLGASNHSVIFLIMKDFLKWVLAANILACPIAFMMTKKWLENFAYRASLGPQIFLFSAIIAFSIVIMVVGYQSTKAARAKPVDSLNCEL